MRAAEQDRPDVAAKLAEWRAAQAGLDPDQLVFLDETWATTSIVRRYGWGPAHERVIGRVPHGHRKSTTFVAALRADGLTASMVIDGALTGDLFVAYVWQVPVPELRPGDVVVKDNLQCHKRADGLRAIEAAGCRAAFLPPYSPDLNLIELAFSKLKAVTRLRFDARLYRPLDPPPGRRVGRPRTWGDRLPAPQHHDRWSVPWQDGAAYLYGRRRRFRVKELPCRWSVTGPTEPVRVLAAEVEGYDEPWFLVTTSATLTAAEVVAVFAARFRQEDGFRDHKQRLGMEECRAWTKAPVERTFAVQVVTQTLLRLLGWRLDATAGAGGWWSAPDWNRHKSHPSLLDVRRVVWAARAEFSNVLRGLDGVRECDAAPGNHEGAAA